MIQGNLVEYFMHCLENLKKLLDFVYKKSTGKFQK